MHEGVALSRSLGQFSPGLSQENAAVGLHRNQALSLKPLNGARDGNMADSKPNRQIDDPRLPLLRDQRLDELDVVLALLALMIFAGALKAVGRHAFEL